MTKRKDEITEYLKALKFEHEANALREISIQGSEHYAQSENEKAAMVQEIIEIVNKVTDFETGHITINEMRKFAGLEPLTIKDGYAYILSTKDGRWPSKIAFNSEEEAERYVESNGITKCSLAIIQYAKKDIIP